MRSALVLLFLGFQLTGFGQKDGITLYAFEQKVIPGIAPARDVVEGGKVVKKTSWAEKQYYIFLTTPDNITVYPVLVWIKGKAFGVRSKESATPVKRLSTNDTTIVLVPKTEQRVVRLFPVETALGKQQWGATLAKQNELVLVYKIKGRHYYLVKERFERLDATNLP
jgi:hypothetical protein